MSNSSFHISPSSFSHRHWRPTQREICNAAMAGRDVFATMPTGGGKSLCYQIPAVLSRGLTIVVSPLISLIQDQVLLVRSLDIPCVYSSSTLDEEQSREMFRRLRSLQPGEDLLFFTTPEKLTHSNSTMEVLMNLNSRKLISRYAVLLSSSGHLPDYLSFLSVIHQASLCPCVILLPPRCLDMPDTSLPAW